ncbi:hypothetical protein NC653_000201 [Populus alba x Populus x berolinensis]|uniref:Uncharacterized protein n=1 Tax=Populus alba x Populus x berolinensis TaxID=444605 RepID=A0AAD6RJ88_9ROSI|nr:hypothetical protein NC653_000201 [Populus alba x Populus x berolinensis]
MDLTVVYNVHMEHELGPLDQDFIPENDHLAHLRKSENKMISNPVGPYPSRAVSVGIVLGFQAWYLPWISSSIDPNPSVHVSVDICIGFQAWLMSINFKLYLPWFSSPIDNLSWFSSSVDPIPLRAVSVGIDLGFRVWLVLGH